MADIAGEAIIRESPTEPRMRPCLLLLASAHVASARPPATFDVPVFGDPQPQTAVDADCYRRD